MYQLELDSINAVLQYLGSRPYAEVAGLIPLLHAAQKVEIINEPITVEGEVVNG